MIKGIDNFIYNQGQYQIYFISGAVNMLQVQYAHFSWERVAWKAKLIISVIFSLIKYLGPQPNILVI